ncbi:MULTISPECIES: ATP-binding protein [unclassified Nostoc]|uniref:ATP-binding protein n=1 Tax=unclassified Nostoc TaxID=2593658 RepID=UPI002AD538DF|nr:ATP-binding protein [Nostoc sp. DedQUE03]MDZ7975632.1 ATP-binding protein [Nostoc sp. DedQUE03]MDZ8047438.1 ATP-binding protein [Nostoc sp. DedQUE02]
MYSTAAEAQIFSKPISQAVEISPDFNGLQPLLVRLDWLIKQAIFILQTQRQAEGELGVSWLQKTEISSEQTSITIRSDSLLAWLQTTFGLSTFDLDILAIALAPELDRHYEKVFAYLQDDMSNKRPTVDMVLNLLCSSVPEKLSRRKHFTTNSPLIYHRLLHLCPEPHQQQSTFLSHRLILDSQVVRLLLHQPGLDSRLISCCQLLEPSIYFDTLYLKADVQTALEVLVREDWQKQQPLLLYFQGNDACGGLRLRTGKRRTAQWLAKTLEVPLLVADLAKMVEDKANFEEKLQLLWREAWFFNRLLYIDNFDILYLQEHQILYQSFLRELEKNIGITILSGVENWIPTATGAIGLITVSFTVPESSQRRDCWQTHLQAAQISIEDKELDVLSDRFLLTPDQIADAVATAYNTARWQQIDSIKEKPLPSFLNLCSAARAQSGHDLATLARKIEPKYTWDDIVLHPNQITQLQDICKEAEYRNLVHQKWGFADKLSLGKGLNVLFSGSSGTGKTMAAEVIAHQLQLDLYKIDLSQIVSKYIGETEKNLNRIFTAATNSNAILFFDEADALFGKRSEVQDARDRYANIEVGYLLQKMEEYEGIAILTTNLRSNIDPAFERRLRFIIEFLLPDTKNRHLIWQKIFPKNAPCSPNLDLELLAQNFEITGANIRNIALTAAFLAADDRGGIEMVHLIRALRREYQKMGQILRDKDLGQYVDLR